MTGDGNALGGEGFVSGVGQAGDLIHLEARVAADMSVPPGATSISSVGPNAHLDFRPGSSGVIPEPLTVLGVLLGVGGLGCYIRKRR